MNKKQKMIKKMAKRAKAKENKKEKPNPSAQLKHRYISKAERAKLEQIQQQTSENLSEVEM